MIEAGCTVIGGHSVRDPEIKFGYAVTGTVRPDRVLANSGVKVLDALILTKAIGTGVISTAIKRGQAREAWIESAVRSMTSLNSLAAEIAQNGRFSVHAATDVTGFGLIGHLREMAAASGVSVRINSAKVPLLPGAMDCVRAGFIPGGLIANREFAECHVRFEQSVPEEVRTILFDPQTAGGLLLAVAQQDGEKIVTALRASGLQVVEIGTALPQSKPLIQVH
jgi:selenide,water dikinase